MSVIERLEKLRKRMTEVGVSVCLIPTSDCHDSEYISDYFKVREYYSGFTGSAGTLIVGMNKAALFTDGRYFVQAKRELVGSSIDLMRMGEPGVPTEDEYICSILSDNETVGFDGRLIGSFRGEKIAQAIKNKKCNVDYTFEPAQKVWEDRPKLEFKPIYRLKEEFSGETTLDKIRRIYDYMDSRGVDTHVITSLDDIAWILNLRGDDVTCCPVFFAYIVFAKHECHLYANMGKDNTDNILLYLKENGIVLHEYDKFYEDGIQRVNNCTQKGLLYNKARLNYATYMKLNNQMKVLDEIEPSTRFKCIKNAVEIKNIREANVKDGVAVVRFERWLHEELKKGNCVTELEAQAKLYEFRTMDKDMIEPSFDTICAYAEHGAIIHYESTPATDCRICDGSFLVMDSGAHYYQGTTDVTRTYCIGEVNEKLKHNYTLVLRSMLKLMNHRFPYGSRGNNLDVVARELFWKEGVDFKHGTGHGIGYLLNVHEGPNRIGWKIPANAEPGIVFEAGMVTSDEPGIYFEGEFGVRIETDILCKEIENNEFGRFMGFEALTYVPIDMKPVLIDEMSEEEIGCLNDYHRLVYEKLSPYLDGDDLNYLKKATELV